MTVERRRRRTGREQLAPEVAPDETARPGQWACEWLPRRVAHEPAVQQQQRRTVAVYSVRQHVDDGFHGPGVLSRLAGVRT
jgi:hypothetical protein